MICRILPDRPSRESIPAGQRLADEIQLIISQNASLQYISCIGHSMGGLLARYAIGEAACVLGRKITHGPICRSVVMPLYP